MLKNIYPFNSVVQIINVLLRNKKEWIIIESRGNKSMASKVSDIVDDLITPNSLTTYILMNKFGIKNIDI